jgi:hypothetical protein
MTKRKETKEDSYSQLELNQYGLRKLSIDLVAGVHLQAADRKALARALWRIGNGEDANVVFGVKARRGQRKTPGQAAKRFKMRAAVGWVAAAIRSRDEGGLGYSLADALERAAKSFRLSDETLLTYWRDNPEWRTPTFSRPIYTLPD